MEFHVMAGFLLLINLSVIATKTEELMKNSSNHFFNDTHQLKQIVSLTNSSPSCVFNKSICSYKIIQDDLKLQKVTWSLISNPFIEKPKGNYVSLVGSGKEGDRSFLQSPIFQTSTKDRVEFFYYLYGDNPGQLHVTFTEDKTKTGHKFWVDLENHGKNLNYGCLELPPNQTGHLIFTGILGTKAERIIAVQKVTISQGGCEANVQKSTCTFDNPMLCNYTLVCTPASEYIWKRHKGATPTHGTGPDGDVVEPFNGFYLYAESSYGKQGDSAIVNFPVRNTTGKYLNFWYHMYGRNIGSLHLRYNFGQLNKEEWTVSGSQENKWRHFCQQIHDDIDSFSLVAVRGSSFLGDIAIDNVRVNDQQCTNKSLDCNFNSNSICGYNNNQWFRVKTANGFKMSTNVSVEVNSMKSPTVDLHDSCVRIRYQLFSPVTTLIVYENLQVKFRLPFSNRDLATVQFYVNNSRMYLKFETSKKNSNASIDSVSVIKGSCPVLECPRRMKSCNDRKYCVPKNEVCNWKNNCQDGSDEICSNSIACDFEYYNNCGYTGKNNMYSKQQESRNNSDYHIILYGRQTDWSSPFQQVMKNSCVKFSYRGVQSLVEVFVRYSKNRKSVKVWFKSLNQESPWSVGQFFVSAGNIQLVFKLYGSFLSYLHMDDIVLLPGSCPPIVCEKDHVPCAENNQCIKKTDICNRKYDCMDKSDESNCNSSIACDFEDPYFCGYRFNKSWKVTNGRKEGTPRLDHSQGTYYGHFMMQPLSDDILFSPEVFLANVTCVRFYFIMIMGNAVLSVYDNNVVQLEIKSNQIIQWQMAQLQLDAGNHTLGFQLTAKIPAFLAIDSISTISSKCPKMDCPKKWKPCTFADICVPESRFCDGINDCPNGEDENNCTTNQTIRLILGENANQGYVLYRINETWNRVGYENEDKQSTKINAMVVCRELGYKGIARETFKTARPFYTFSNIKSVSCNGKERLLSECSMKFCDQCYLQYSLTVDCSDHHCFSDQVPCPGKNGKSYDSSSRCIWKYNLCDGEYDCPGGTDEKNCKSCNLNEFRCRNKQCIPQTQRCNGVPECRDSSDERECLMHNGTDIFLMYNGKYEILCENNFNKQLMANELCKLAGKGNGTISQSSKVKQGIEFIVSSNSRGVIPGYSRKGMTSCRILNLMCNLKTCGIRPLLAFEPNIKYGIFALPGEWPWQVVIFRNIKFICGGTLISKRYVLTAAHCVEENGNYEVKVGSLSKLYDSSMNVVKKITIHPNYNNKTFKHDVALVELSNLVKTDDYVQIACLPTHPAIPNTQCYSTGWGVTEEGSSPKYLKETKVNILKNETCKSYYPNSDKVVVCANHIEPYQPACFGDSGSPLQCLNKNNRWEIVGITSYGQARCLGKIDSPQAYADVYSHLDWIRENTPNL